ncbi:MAG: RimK family alpha-L-glutamate ligase [Candidatus Altarchaeum sp.]|nr:RimK family alpha-L-glutamate ligase [Candidatus Altarchaeum sp.]
MKIAIIPKDERDKGFVSALKTKGAEVTIIAQNFISAKFDENIRFKWTYFNEGRNFCYVARHIKTYFNSEGVNLLNFDLIFLRQNEILNEKDKFLFDTIEMLENEGMNVINPTNGIRISKDKYLGYYYLKKKEINIPETYASNDEMSTYFQILNTKKSKDNKDKFVFKPMSGKGGIGIVITKEKSTAGDILSMFALNNKVTIFQKFVKNNKDMRIIVVGDEVIGGIERIAGRGMNKNGISTGGKAVAFKVSDELKEISVKASKSLGCKISGVDIMEDKESNNYRVLEVNCSPAFDGFQRATKLNVYEKIADYLVKEGKR